jgi:hypothetical protein
MAGMNDEDKSLKLSFPNYLRGAANHPFRAWHGLGCRGAAGATLTGSRSWPEVLLQSILLAVSCGYRFDFD